jgi:hypothetical protein
MGHDARVAERCALEHVFAGEGRTENQLPGLGQFAAHGGCDCGIRLEQPGQVGVMAREPGKYAGQEFLDLGVVEGEYAAHQILGAMDVRRLRAGQEEPPDHSLEVGDEVLVCVVRDEC